MLEIVRLDATGWLLVAFHPTTGIRAASVFNLDVDEQLAIASLWAAFHCPSLRPAQVGRIVAQACSRRPGTPRTDR